MQQHDVIIIESLAGIIVLLVGWLKIASDRRTAALEKRIKIIESDYVCEHDCERQHSEESKKLDMVLDQVSGLNVSINGLRDTIITGLMKEGKG